MLAHDWRELAAVFVGGAAGTVLRALLGLNVTVAPGHWPWPTLVVNIAGAFLLGYISTRLLERLPLSGYRRPMLGTGVCGGLTTFSTMQVETLRMLHQHLYAMAAGYVLVSVALGFAATHLATSLARRVRVTA